MKGFSVARRMYRMMNSYAHLRCSLRGALILFVLLLLCHFNLAAADAQGSAGRAATGGPSQREGRHQEAGQGLPEPFKQAFQLVRAGKVAEAEEPINLALAGTNTSQLSKSDLYEARGFLRAENGRFKLAAEDLQLAISMEPDEHALWFFLTPVLIEAGQIDEYREHSKNMLYRFRETTNGAVAERTAKSYLLSPSGMSASDLSSAAKVAQRAVSFAKKGEAIPWRRMVLALAEYRQGHFDRAIKTLQQAQKELAATRYAGHDACHADAWFISAMAHYQLKQKDEARTDFAHGRVIVQSRIPKLSGKDLSFGWVDVLMTHILMREAETMTGAAVSGK